MKERERDAHCNNLRMAIHQVTGQDCGDNLQYAPWNTPVVVVSGGVAMEEEQVRARMERLGQMAREITRRVDGMEAPVLKHTYRP